MEDVTVILGENGKGKTRYLLNFFEQHKHEYCIALISNALINPFPLVRRTSKHDYYSLRARQHPYGNYFERAINSYFFRLLENHNPREIFYILSHIGFDNDFVVRRKPLYKVEESYNAYDKKTKYTLVNSSYAKEHFQYNSIERKEITPGFAQEISIFLEESHDFHLSYESHHRENQEYSDHVKKEKYFVKGIGDFRRSTLFGSELFFRKDGRYFPIYHASSGELHILSLGLFINRFIEESERYKLPRVILIDEPENSLHPKWQRDYIGFLKGFIGYSEVKTIIATHSPLIAMEDGAYNKSISLVSVENSILVPINHKKNDNNIEQIYYELFGVLTPKNRYLSEYCNGLLKQFSDKKVSYDVAYNAIFSMREASFDSNQKDFLSGVIEILKKLKGNHNG
ncbi:TPA: ATP-binding protein [Enterobacter hormaechei subsp. steigerwaltii]|uniref:AAA family ATPase n=1 Tax=Enterobacter hormaechei TaxID=158836 RepID=UPI000F861187|nr:AAA family ATPase [Enterobacter hormaechei]MBT2076151.1 AAA family ATPase [Enterobacter hormaechei subsp. xiangfangensis]HAV1660634.1 ATP-binding protein [Enterobacter hormaechei subsp. steigerwaltii]EKY3918202.1 ATP-binding protein [Enterobacter hormaechei]ELC6537422.1 ATP-binding protein [Enterobacter hormaechei]MCE1932069.1 ATP-binding protein [Enterobacter hormaechei]